MKHHSAQQKFTLGFFTQMLIRVPILPPPFALQWGNIYFGCTASRAAQTVYNGIRQNHDSAAQRSRS